jgi:hypothetical protein
MARCRGSSISPFDLGPVKLEGSERSACRLDKLLPVWYRCMVPFVWCSSHGGMDGSQIGESLMAWGWRMGICRCRDTLPLNSVLGGFE